MSISLTYLTRAVVRYRYDSDDSNGSVDSDIDARPRSRAAAAIAANSVATAQPCQEGYRARMALTPSRQRNAVSEGMGLGLLMRGRDSLPYDKTRLDLAFANAWRSWPHRSKFPQVNTDLANGLDETWAFTRVDAQKKTVVLYWRQEARQFQICARQPDWTPENREDLDFAAEAIDGDVPLTAWGELAQEFLNRFEPQQEH